MVTIAAVLVALIFPDMACGTTARVRRGAEATWQPVGGPHEAQGGAQSAATWQGATRPRGSTWAPVWGATWQRTGRWRAHGYSRPCLEYWCGNANALPPSPIYTRWVFSIFPCGTMCRLISYLVGHVALREASDSMEKRRDSSIAWTRVHAIINQDTCFKNRISERD